MLFVGLAAQESKDLLRAQVPKIGMSLYNLGQFEGKKNIFLQIVPLFDLKNSSLIGYPLSKE